MKKTDERVKKPVKIVILKIVTACALVFCIAFTAVYGKYKISAGVTVKPKPPEKTIISVWQIDTFEGGTGSRQRFLSENARAFEKANPEILVMVTTQTAESAKTAFENGLRPDLVSYGAGVELSGFSEINCGRNTACGLIGEKQFAAVWCRGVYALYENPEIIKTEYEKTAVSAGNFNIPAAAFALSSAFGSKANDKAGVQNEAGIITDGRTGGEGLPIFDESKTEYLSPMDAYIKFVSGKAKYLLGTQRDAVRLKNRGFSAKMTPLIGFSDLNQFISLTSTEQTKAVYAERFIQYLLTDEVQKKLNRINMFSGIADVEYDDADFVALQNAAKKNSETGLSVSAFVTAAELSELRDLAGKAAHGNKECLFKLKKVLI